MIGAVVDQLRDAARRSMPRHQARRFEQVLVTLERQRSVAALALPEMPPITIDAPPRGYRSSRAKLRLPPREEQLRLL